MENKTSIAIWFQRETFQQILSDLRFRLCDFKNRLAINCAALVPEVSISPRLISLGLAHRQGVCH